MVVHRNAPWYTMIASKVHDGRPWLRRIDAVGLRLQQPRIGSSTGSGTAGAAGRVMVVRRLRSTLYPMRV
ncbi:hypothetical protein ETD86_23365 [Nonomuraea turkmeniaca]|uniref:Uncharacterized protein n=1 Tax=Nonomuraea turkmeniaca TaxID=103838 RepID=A0A5S4FEV0_9ACTN|nr:hypothetical protein [Nonomuraea turkmeniaca]TMR17474.1 hypothetical protein ETD86_23365 [Nonomuraea turkmeniaca]